MFFGGRFGDADPFGRRRGSQLSVDVEVAVLDGGHVRSFARGPGQLGTRTTLTASPRAWAATASFILANGIIVMILSKGNAPAWYISMSRGMNTSGLLSPSTIPLNDRPLACISMRPTDSMAVGAAVAAALADWARLARHGRTDGV